VLLSPYCRRPISKVIYFVNCNARPIIKPNFVLAGVVQGMVTGMRGLCNGLGPAMFGVIFYLFHVDLNDENKNLNIHSNNVDIKSIRNESLHNGYTNYAIDDEYAHLMPGEMKVTHGK
jgi:hypothetical protein